MNDAKRPKPAMQYSLPSNVTKIRKPLRKIVKDSDAKPVNLLAKMLFNFRIGTCLGKSNHQHKFLCNINMYFHLFYVVQTVV